MKSIQMTAVFVVAMVLCSAVSDAADTSDIYVQHENIVFAESHGIGLLMDVFTPKHNHNGLAIVDVMSGGWSSSRGKIRDHKLAKIYDIFCQRGYTVFAIRPGSISKFSGHDMLSHLQRGIEWVKANARDYRIDADRLGLIGASAGGHLACLAAVAAEEASRVAAVGVFFPPTDLVAFAGEDVDLKGNGQAVQLLKALTSQNRLTERSTAKTRESLEQLSPARRVTGGEPPFLLIHGDADRVVPLEQSKLMLQALESKGVSAELIVKAGGGHPWLTIPNEVAMLADWMDKQLKP